MKDEIFSIKLLCDNDEKENILNSKSADVFLSEKKEENGEKEKKYIKYNERVYLLLNKNENTAEKTIEIRIKEEVKKKDDKEEIFKKYKFNKMNCNKIEKEYYGAEKIEKSIGKKDKEIDVNNKYNKIYINPKIKFEKEKCILQNDLGENIGEINDVRSIQALENLNYSRNFIFLNKSKLQIRTVSGNKDLKDKKLKLFIDKEFEKAEKAQKYYSKAIKGLEDENLNNLYMSIVYEKEDNKLVEEIEVILPNDKTLICSFVEEGLYIKKQGKIRNKTKNTQNNVFKMEKGNIEIEIKDKTELTFDGNLEKNEIYKDINGVRRNKNEFIRTISEYKEIESILIEEAENECQAVKYSNLNLKKNRFIISNKEAKKLESWRNKEGYTVVYPTSEKRSLLVGEIKKINLIDDENNENSELEDDCSYIEVEFETDMEKNILPRKDGKLKISFVGDTVRNKRRERALENFKIKNTANENMFDIFDGSYNFGDLKYENTLLPSEIGNLSETQVKAVEGALNTEDIFLIQGPPGTGKTTVIRKIIKKLIKEEKKVLITSAQNLAVDNVMEGIFKEDVIPYRYGDIENKAMRDICKEIADSISDNLENNISKELEEELIEQKEEIELLKIKIINISEKEDLKERLEKIKLSSNNNEVRNKISECINRITGSCKELTNGEISKEYIINNLPEYDEEGKFSDKISILSTSIALKNDKFKNKTTVENILKILEEIEEEYWTDGISESDYNKKINKIKDESKILGNSNSDEGDSLQNILDILEDDMSKIGNYAEDPDYIKIKEFRDRVKNNELLLEEVLRKYPDLMGTTCQKVAAKGFIDISNDASYEYVIVDEAGRADPIDLLIPVIKGKKVILVGDHKQLPHLIENAVENELKELDSQEMVDKYVRESLFGRLYEELPSDRKIMLDTQYRMNKEIGDAVSSLFYENKLKTGKNKNNDNDTPIYEGKSLIAINVNSKQSLSNKSYKNELEMNFIINKLKEIDKNLEEYSKRNKKLSVGVISFYKLQADMISKNLRKCKFKNIDVSSGTVDSYQGLEKDIIFISSVRTEGIGFIANKNRLNVALSRAKKMAIIVGHLENLRKDETFDKLLNKCHCEGE